MKKEDFFEVLGELDDDIVKGAKTSMKKKMNWKAWGAMAACLCLIVSGIFLYNQNISDNSPENNNIAMLFMEAKVVEVYSPRSVLVEIVEENIYNADTEENLFLAGDMVQADFNEEIVLHFSAGDIVVIGRGDTAKVDYSKEPYIAQCNSIRIKAEEDYRNIRVDVEDNEGAENAGLAFVENIYGSFLSNLPEDNNYRITDYKLLDHSIILAADNSVSGEFTFAIKAVNEDYYAGEYTLKGSGEYDGWLILRKSFALERRNTGYWHCVELEDVVLSDGSYTENGI